MESLISACGLDCSTCPWYPNTCNGCHAVKGSTFWAKDALPDKTCALYNCAITVKGYQNCGGCAELPCKNFIEQKDPNSSQEEHLASIKIRVARLKGVQ
ncbi:MAG: DUF3795 domain-containing protein [Ignavibacteriae bacterium]|nr:MAG: DUF3795 domain-containing protein [Ignavibacteriota bacterium]